MNVKYLKGYFLKIKYLRSEREGIGKEGKRNISIIGNCFDNSNIKVDMLKMIPGLIESLISENS